MTVKAFVEIQVVTAGTTVTGLITTMDLLAVETLPTTFTTIKI